MCQSLGNPSKLVIYLFGTLLALAQIVSPQYLSSLFLSLSSLHPPSLLQFSLVSHLLSHLPLSFCSQSVFPFPVIPHASLILLPLYSSTPPTRSKTLSLFILLLFPHLSLFLLLSLSPPSLPLTFFFQILSCVSLTFSQTLFFCSSLTPSFSFQFFSSFYFFFLRSFYGFLKSLFFSK